MRFYMFILFFYHVNSFIKPKQCLFLKYNKTLQQNITVPIVRQKQPTQIEEGYIYCLSNPLYPNTYKVGTTKKDPKIRAKQLYTTGVPEPFKIEFAKKTQDYKRKEVIVHDLLSTCGQRFHKREFFNVSLDTIRKLFELIDGENIYP
jgi:T5orf172 domain